MALGAVVAAALAPVGAQQAVQPSRFARAPMVQPPARGEVEVLPIRGNLYAIFGAGGNVVASVGADGVLLVDSGSPDMTDKVAAAITRLQRGWAARNPVRPLGWGAETRSSVADRGVPAPVKPIRFIINTHADADHYGGNERLKRSGRTFTGGNVAGNIADASEGAAILAHENVLMRLTRGPDAASIAFDTLPTDTYFVDYYKLSHFFNGEGVQLLHAPNAHSDGDSIVYFRGTDVFALGDLMATERYPEIDVEHGGSIGGIIDALNRVLEMSFAEFRLEGGTMMVPGHGRLVDSGDVAYYRDMLTIIRDRIKDLHGKGRTLAEVKAARPTADYDTQYAATSGLSSTDGFVEAVFKSVEGGGVKAPSR